MRDAIINKTFLPNYVRSTFKARCHFSTRSCLNTGRRWPGRLGHTRLAETPGWRRPIRPFRCHTIRSVSLCASHRRDGIARLHIDNGLQIIVHRHTGNGWPSARSRDSHARCDDGWRPRCFATAPDHYESPIGGARPTLRSPEDVGTWIGR